MRTLTPQETRATAGGTYSCFSLLSLFCFKRPTRCTKPTLPSCEPTPPKCGGTGTGTGTGGGTDPTPPLEIE